MHEQDNELTLTQNALTEEQKAEILSRRKQAIMSLLDEMKGTLPAMAQSMLTMYRSTVFQFVDGFTYEQTEEMIDRVQSIIDGIRG